MEQISIPAISPDGPNCVLDITGETCPMTFVRTRLALDRIQPGQLLLVHLRGIESTLEVPRAVLELGHDVVAITESGESTTVLIRRR